MRLLIFTLLTVSLSLLAHADGSSVCAFNQPPAYRPNNFEFGESEAARARRLSSAPRQGWVEDFGGVLERTQSALSKAVLWGSECPGEGGAATREETYSLHCAGEKGRGYSFTNVEAIDDLVNIPVQSMDPLQEELIFLTAAQNIDELGQCQQGLFNQYFSPTSPQRSQMLNRAFSEFERIRPKIQERLNQRAPAEVSRARGQNFLGCIKDSCMLNRQGMEDAGKLEETEAKIEEIDREISILLSGIPMGNRQKMKEALVHLYRVNPEANLNQFAAVFDSKMRELKEEADSTVKTMDGLRQVGPDGKKFYCVDSRLKRQLYRSGQVELVLQGLQAPDVTRPLSCRMGPRYGVGGEVLTELALVPTYMVGYGFARLALRAGSLAVRGVRVGRGLTVGTRAALLGVEAADAALFVNSTADACFSSDFMVGLQGASCNPENEIAQAMHEAEIGQCVANVLFFGMSNVAARGIAGAASEVVDGGEIVVQASRRAPRTRVSDRELRQASALTMDQRWARSRELLGRNLNDQEKTAIREAHEIGAQNGFGNYTLAEIRAKRERLSAAGFSPAEIRLLMEKGITGAFRESDVAARATPPPRPQVNRQRTAEGLVVDDVVALAESGNLESAMARIQRSLDREGVTPDQLIKGRGGLDSRIVRLDMALAQGDNPALLAQRDALVMARAQIRFARLRRNLRDANKEIPERVMLGFTRPETPPVDMREAERFKNPQTFIQETRERYLGNKRLPKEQQKGEIAIYRDDPKEALDFVYKLPGVDALKFGTPGGSGWQRFNGGLEQSALYGRPVGYFRTINGRRAEVRVDWDATKGGHFNIDIPGVDVNGNPIQHKLAVGFRCSGRPCTEAEVYDMANSLVP